MLGPVPDVHASSSTTTGAPSVENPVFGDVDHPGIGTLLTPTSPLRFADVLDGPPAARRSSGPTPTRCSSEVLGLSAGEIGRLHDDGLVASARQVGA